MTTPRRWPVVLLGAMCLSLGMNGGAILAGWPERCAVQVPNSEEPVRDYIVAQRIKTAGHILALERALAWHAQRAEGLRTVWRVVSEGGAQ